MIKRTRDLESLNELKSHLIYPNKDSDIQLAKGLEEFVKYVIQQGNDDQKFSVAYEKLSECGSFAGRPAPGSVKTMVYALPDSTLLLCLLDMEKYLDRDKVAHLYSSDTQLKKASLDDLKELGMAQEGCHGFVSSECDRDWKIVVDDGIQRHPIYVDRTSKKMGALLAGSDTYAEIMQARFPSKILREKISK